MRRENISGGNTREMIRWSIDDKVGKEEGGVKLRYLRAEDGEYELDLSLSKLTSVAFLSKA